MHSRNLSANFCKKFRRSRRPRPRVCRKPHRGSQRRSKKRHIGIVCPLFAGHLNPMMALAAGFARRGYQVTFFSPMEQEIPLRTRGFRFASYGEWSDLAQLDRGLLDSDAILNPLTPFWASFELELMVINHRVHRLPAALKREKIDLVLADQVSHGSGTAAEKAGLPYITVSNALALNFDAAIPPFDSRLPYKEGGGIMRNYTGLKTAGFYAFTKMVCIY